MGTRKLSVKGQDSLGVIIGNVNIKSQQRKIYEKENKRKY